MECEQSCRKSPGLVIVLREPLPVMGSREDREQWKSLTVCTVPLPDLLRIGD